MSSPTQRTLKKLRDEGYLAEVVERWNSWAKVRQDLFGFVDIVAVKGGRVLAVQATSYSNMGARVKKIMASPHFEAVRAAMAVEVWGWRKRDRRWEVTIKPVLQSQNET